MNIKSSGLLAVAALVALSAGCAKREAAVVPAEKPAVAAVNLVPEGERSRHFQAVTRQLELGGTVYGYVDIDGDVAKIAGSMQQLTGQLAAELPQLAPWQRQDFPALVEMLGLNDVKAFGVSSVPEGTGFFRNRMFFHTPGPRQGLLAALGGKPAPFARLGLAPADADVYAEAELDLAEVYRVVKAVVAKTSGEPAADLMEAQLKKAGEAAAFSLYGLVTGWKGRSALVARLDPKQTVRLPGAKPVVLPLPALLLSFDGIAPVVEPALVRSGQFAVSEEKGLKFYTVKMPLPLQGIQPVFVVEGARLHLATSVAFAQECIGGGTARLADQAKFREALAPLGAEGNGLLYVHPRFFETLRTLDALNPQIQPADRKVLTFWLSQLPVTDRPLISIRTNLPDGVLIKSYWNRSAKQDLAALAVYNPVTIGLLAGMAVPAFQKVRQSSQEKAVLNNLRQLSAAADQYYLESGKNAASLDDLVGSGPNHLIRRLAPVAGEDYRKVRLAAGQPVEVFVPSLRKVVRYEP